MKESTKIAEGMAKVRTCNLLILKLLTALIGKYLWNNGNKYEGEYKDDKRNG